MAGKPLQLAPFTVDPFTLEIESNNIIYNLIFFVRFFFRFVLFCFLNLKSETAGWSGVEAAGVITPHTD